MTNLHVAIVSSGRPGNVPTMEHHVLTGGLPTPVWYVGDGEAADYTYCGAAHVIEAGPLCVARNRALDDADGQHCLQLSDDLRRVDWANGRTAAEVEPINLGEATKRILHAMGTTRALLGGGAPTANPYFSRERINQRGFVVGDLIVIAAGCPLRFDEALPLKEDYDYTLQHLHTYGKVARLDALLPVFSHRTNKGGAVTVRTPELEQQAIARLMAKWPGQLRPNPKRPNEILLRWRPLASGPSVAHHR